MTGTKTIRGKRRVGAMERERGKKQELSKEKEEKLTEVQKDAEEKGTWILFCVKMEDGNEVIDMT